LEFGNTLSRAFKQWSQPEKESRERSSLTEFAFSTRDNEWEAWKSIRFTVTSVRYQSLSLGLLFVGTREVFKAIDENPEVFAELLHALAPQALDEVLGANVSNWLDLDVTAAKSRRKKLGERGHGEGVSPSPSALLVRYFAPLLPILIGLSLVFVVAYNTYTESRADISATAKRRDLLLERQEKLLEAQNSRIAALETRLSGLLTIPSTPTSQAPAAPAAVTNPPPPHPTESAKR
jgi:hypothetical protein